jgi:glutathione S-transferase
MATTQLFVNRVCPYAHRAFITAVEKGLIGNGVELVEISLPTPDWYNRDVNPREMLPALRLPNGAGNIPESLIVAQYLDEAFPDRGPQLFPTDPQERADARLFISDVDTLVKGFYGVLFTKEPEELKKKWENVKEDVQYINGVLEKRGKGPFFLGERYSLADIALVPFLDRFRATLKAYRGIDIFETAPRLRTLLEAAELRESFKTTALPQQQYVDGYAKYINKEE